MGYRKFTYDKAVGMVFEVCICFRPEMAQLLRQKDEQEQGKKPKDGQKAKKAGKVEAQKPGTSGRKGKKRVDCLQLFRAYMEILERLFNITVLKADFTCDLAVLMVYLPKDELPQDEVDRRCFEYAGLGFPLHLDYTGRDLNDLGKFVAMLKRHCTRIYARANRLKRDRSLWKEDYRLRRLDPKALTRMLGDEDLDRVKAKLADLHEDVTPSTERIYVNRYGIGTESFLLELERRAGWKAGKLPWFELEEGNCRTFLERLEDATGVDIVDAFWDIVRARGKSPGYKLSSLIGNALIVYPAYLVGSLFYSSLWRFAIIPVTDWVSGRLAERASAKAKAE